MQKVADKLFECLSLGLGLDGGDIKAAIGGDDLIYLRKINYYPPCPRPDLALGVVAHTDMSSITILVPNEVQGLQVFNNDHWYDVKYIPNALVIHIGDLIEFLSLSLSLSLSVCVYMYISFSNKPNSIYTPNRKIHNR